MGHLQIRNWERYQHYKNRNPPWVKLYVTILEDEELRSLPVPSRLLANLLLCVAAKRDNLIPDNPAWIAEEVGLPAKVIAKSLADLLAVSFLERKQKRTENAMPRDRDREQRERQITTSSSNGYVVPDMALWKLLRALTDRDEGTEGVLNALAVKHKLPEAAFGYALDCATGPGVVSPTAVAVAELKKWRRAA